MKTKLAGMAKIQAVVVVLTALFSVVDVASKAMAQQLQRADEVLGVSARLERVGDRLQARAARILEFRKVGAGWLEAWRYSTRPAFAGGSGNPNVKPSNRITLIGKLDPVSQGAATVTTAWLSMADFEYAMALLMVGAMTAGSTVDAKLQQAKDSGGTGAKDITGKAITQLTQAGADSNKQVIIQVRSEELDVDGAFNHVRLSVTVATAASLIAAGLFGLNARYQPETHVATVDEVVG